MNRWLRTAVLAASMFLLSAGHAEAQGTVIASDDFNRPNETPFAINGNWGRTIAGNYNGFANLIGNQVHAVSNEGSYYWNGAGTFDPTRQFSRLTVVEKVGELGLTLLAGPDQAIMVAWGPPGVGDTVYIYWYSGGSDRGVLSTGASSLANGDVIEAALEGGVIFVKVNGVTVKTVANTTTLTSGKPGFITFRNPDLPYVSILDNWEGGTPQSYSIGGTITEGGNGLGGVLVTASGGYGGTTTTNGAGSYTLAGVPAGATSIVVTPTLSGHTMQPLTQTVAGPLGADVSSVDFTSTLSTTATLTVNAAHGTVARNPDLATYAFGTEVTLTAIPDPGYEFASFSGDVPPGHATDNPLSIVMDADRTITANFAAPDVVAFDDFNRPDESPLTVGGNWQQSFVAGHVDLAGQQVAGAAGEAVYYWQGGGTFDAAKQFARLKVVDAGGQLGLVLLGGTNRALVVAWGGGQLVIYWYLNGAGQGELANVPSTLNDGDVVEAILDGGTVYAKINGAVVATSINTTSLPAGRPGFETYLSGAQIDDWEGGTPESFSISGTITENFAGLGGVQVTATGGFAGGAVTNSNGVYTIAGVPLDATSIVLTPTLPGHTMSPTSRTVAGPVTENVTGQDFASSQNTTATLTVLAPHGEVTKDPDLPVYAFGAVVTLTPIPDGGYEFASWSGDVPAGHALDNPLQVTMIQNRAITANFVLPGVVSADYFDRANETPLVEGGNWKRPFIGGLCNLVGNHVESDNGEALYYWQGAGTFDNTRQFSRLHVLQANGQVGLVLLGAEGQGVVVSWGAGRLYVYWYTNGSYQGELLNIASALSNGDQIEAVLDQGIVYAKINGVVVASVANATSLTSGRPGFETYLTGASFDNWEGGSPAAPLCTNAPDGTACDDDNACTTGDVCGAGTCDGAPVVCEDGNACTTDSCDPDSGCVFTNNTDSCDDGDACTTGDVCGGGTCVGSPAPPPPLVEGLTLEGASTTTLTWAEASGAVYDVVSSTLADLRSNGTPSATCVSNDRLTPDFVDERPDPAPDAGFYYLIRAQNSCGTGSYGNDSAGAERTPTAGCP